MTQTVTFLPLVIGRWALLLTCVVAPDSSLGSNAATASYYSTFDSIGLFNYNTTLFNNDSPPKVRENYFQSTAFNSPHQ